MAVGAQGSSTLACRGSWTRGAGAGTGTGGSGGGMVLERRHPRPVSSLDQLYAQAAGASETATCRWWGAWGGVRLMG
eukprot:553858-Rhodomonas_salina.1